MWSSFREAVKGGTRMLQSIQFIGSGPPTYVYSKSAVGLGNAFFHVFAAETRGYDGRQERRHSRHSLLKKEAEMAEYAEQEEAVLAEERKPENLQEVYQKEYGKRESFLWKQR